MVFISVQSFIPNIITPLVYVMNWTKGCDITMGTPHKTLRAVMMKKVGVKTSKLNGEKYVKALRI